MLVFLLLVGYSVSVRPKVEPEEAPNNTISPKPEQKKEPYCGEGPNNGCFNGGKCIESLKVRLESLRSGGSKNLTGTCNCPHGWSGDQCSTCIGRVRLTALDSIQTIHDGNGNYSSNPHSKCSWLIENETPKTKKLELVLKEFKTECGWDHLYIFDGTSALKSKTIGAYCGIIKQQHVLYADSGNAFLHFYSDMAYNMTGFEVEYKLVDKTDETPLKAEFSDSLKNKWSRSQPGFKARAKPSLVSTQGNIYMWGGYQFPDNSTGQSTVDNRIWKYSTEDSNPWSPIDQSETDSSPAVRYSGSMTVGIDENELILYGGVRYNPKYEVLSDLWSFDIKNSKWSEIEIDESNDIKPISNSGHSLVKVIFSNSTSILISIGGYSPKYGYISLVEEFHFLDSKKVQVKIPFTYGTRINGSFGHVAIVDQSEGKKHLVYIYGGYKNSELSDHLTVYNAETRRFSKMTSSTSAGKKRWFHSGVWYKNNLVFMAGNTHTDTQWSTGTLCYSNDVLVYSLDCKNWRTSKNSTVPQWLARYGASTALLDGKIISVGGFNGALLDDQIELSLENSTLITCSPVDRIEPLSLSCASENKRSSSKTYACTNCLNKYSLFQYGKTCGYCSNECSASCPRAPGGALSAIDGSSNDVRSLSCDDEEERGYACNYQSVKCSSCVLSGCQYQLLTDKNNSKQASQKCSTLGMGPIPNPNITSTWYNKTEDCQEPGVANTFECGSFKTCDICTMRSTCMWCGILNTCVSNDAHVTSFPFGQCYEWFQKPHCGQTQCQGHLTCKSCQMDPRCGWCDDGSGTGRGKCHEGTLDGDKNGKCQQDGWFWVDCPTCNCSGHSKCNQNGACINCQNFTTGKNCERCQENYHGIALNNGTCTQCQCGRHGKSCDHKTGKCSCTTKGITGNQCNLCDKEGYTGDAVNTTCYYDIKTDFQYSFRMKEDIDKDVTKLNCKVIPTKAEPGIKVEVQVDNPKNTNITVNSTLSVIVKTSLPYNSTEEHVAQSNNTKKFSAEVDINQFEFGPETNRTILIYIYNFTTPLTIKVTVTQHAPMSLLTFFLVFFACFLSLLLIAVIVWKLKTMWDVQLQRRAVMNEMRQMAARPFASVEMQLNPENKLLTVEQPSPACYEILDDGHAAVATVLMLLPRDPDGAPPVGDSAVCFGSVMINYNEKYESDLLLDSFDEVGSCDGDQRDNPNQSSISTT